MDITHYRQAEYRFELSPIHSQFIEGGMDLYRNSAITSSLLRYIR